MTEIENRKNVLTEELSRQYSHNTIGMDEYERLLEYINKIETSRELAVIEKVVRENDDRAGMVSSPASTSTPAHAPDEIRTAEKRPSLLSRFFSAIMPYDRNGGKYSCVFSSNRIDIDNLPKGKTVIRVECAFGKTEIVVAPNIKIVNKITPVFSTVNVPIEIYDSENLPELHIKGDAVFSSVIITRKKF